MRKGWVRKEKKRREIRSKKRRKERKEGRRLKQILKTNTVRVEQT